jgi:hypothetical protein
MASEDINLETFSLVWLDENVNKSKTNINAKEKLRRCINHLRVFENVNDCELYIQSVRNDDRIIWIVNDSAGKILVPRIHQLQSISSIYIYDENKKIDEKWTKNYAKVNKV